jgi:ABC-type sugar transport system ATPase subunit
MRDGRIEQTGSPLELYDHPANQFVAGFIGSPAMNFLPGKRSGDDVDVGNGVRIPIPAELRSKAGEAVTLGVRPEHLVATGGTGPAFKFTVETVEALGADSHVHGVFGTSMLVAKVWEDNTMLYLFSVVLGGIAGGFILTSRLYESRKGC